MNKLKLRTKVEVVLVVLLLLSITTASVMSITRTISDEGDDVYTFIRNSNGNYWEATGANIQAAIDDCGSYGWVEIPEGTIDISTIIYMDNNIWLRGSGIGATVLRQANGANLGDIIYCADLSKFTISDLTVDGNRANNPNGFNNIEADGCTDFIIRDVFITSPSKGGLRIDDSSRRGVVSNVQITDIDGTQQGLAVATAYDMRFSDIIVWDCDDDFAIDFSNMHSSIVNNIRVYDTPMGIKITGASYGNYYNEYNNIVVNVNEDAADAALKIQYAHYCNFNNIYAEGTGIIVYGSTYFCDNNNFNNIHIRNTNTYGLSVGGNNNNFNNIYIENTGTYGIYVTGDGNKFSNCNVSKHGNYNLFEGANHFDIISSSFNNGGEYGLVIKDCHYFSISHCEIINNGYDGIDLSIGSANSNYSIDNCIFYGNDGADNLAIDCHANDDYIIIVNNICYNDGIDDHYQTKGIVENNIGDDI